MSVPQDKVDTKNKTILLIEDSDDLRTDVIEMLTLEGYNTAGAENGVIGVEMARKLMPDLIICDIMMPQLDGYGVLQILRSEAGTSAIPFIFLTAKTEHIDQRQGMVLGADDFLTKPFLAKELLDSIDAQLKKREEQLAAVKRRIDDLTASIAQSLPHEFRTPLNTIIGFSEMLQSEAQNLKPDQVAGWAGHIHTAGYRLYRVVENYLLFVRLQLQIENNVKGGDDSAVENFNLVAQAQATSVAKTYNRSDDLDMELEESPVLAITGEYASKIVEELIDNAFKFSRKGQSVIVRGSLEDDMYILQVTDKGRGMSPAQTLEINAFMQFERDHYEQQGMGLGLALVKQLSEIYSVNLGIEGDKDQGITATVRIPTK